MNGPQHHGEQIIIPGLGSAFIDGVPDRCDHDYSIVVWILANGDVLDEPHYRCPTDEATAEYVQAEAHRRGSNIVEGSTRCTKCRKIYQPNLFI